MKYGDKITVRVPKGPTPNAIFRKRGAKRLRLVDTDDEVLAGLAGCPVAKASRSGADYYTQEPEPAVYDSWIEMHVRRGNLELVPSIAPWEPRPTNANAEKPVPLNKE